MSIVYYRFGEAMIAQELEMPIEDALRKALAKANENGVSLYKIAADSGVDYAALHKFASGARPDIRISTAEKLCVYFQLGVVPSKGVALSAGKRSPPKRKK
jgi:DNA-binding Xre family transcriptional regulator